MKLELAGHLGAALCGCGCVCMREVRRFQKMLTLKACAIVCQILVGFPERIPLSFSVFLVIARKRENDNLGK